MTETVVWRRLRETCPSTTHLVRVELRSRSGFPDCLWIAGGVTSFIELKWVNTPFSHEAALRRFPWGISVPQYQTLRDLMVTGAPVYVVVGHGQPLTALATYPFGGLLNAYHAYWRKRERPQELPPFGVDAPRAFRWDRIDPRPVPGRAGAYPAETPPSPRAPRQTPPT